jgi:hypothetical protein
LDFAISVQMKFTIFPRSSSQNESKIGKTVNFI